MDGNRTLTQITEARGHRMPSPSLEAGAPRAMPFSGEGNAAVGLNRGRSAGARRVQDHTPLCALRSPSMEWGARSQSSITALSTVPACTPCLHLCSLGCHTPLPPAFSLQAVGTPTSEQHVTPSPQACPPSRASPKKCVLVLPAVSTFLPC